MTRTLRVFGPYTTAQRDTLNTAIETDAIILNSDSGKLERWTGTAWQQIGDVRGTSIIDFGSFPGGSDTSLVVTGQTAITAASVINVNLSPVATADHTADEHLVETLKVFAGNIVAGTGFTIYGVNSAQPSGIDATRIYGKWTVAWSWSY